MHNIIILTEVTGSNFLAESVLSKNSKRECFELEAGGKPSTWFPPGRLVELIIKPNEALQKFRFTRENT